MSRVDVLELMKYKKASALDFVYDALYIPPPYVYLTGDDINQINSIANSARLSAKIDTKYQMVDQIMRYRGFVRFAGGTNRIVYKFTEDDRFLVKVAVDKVGIRANLAEYDNQYMLKPYCTKVFYTSPDGAVSFVERVLPIKNKAEFRNIADDVFNLIVFKILGELVIDDIGTKYFMNWGIRKGFGPVVLDFPCCFRLDGAKLYCNGTLEDGTPCNGEIDYDDGFNHLICQKCGRPYQAADLKDDNVDNRIIIKGGNSMKIQITHEDGKVYTTNASSEVIHNRTKRTQAPSPKFTIEMTTSDDKKILIKKGEDTKPVEEEKKVDSEPSDSVEKSDESHDNESTDSENSTLDDSNETHDTKSDDQPSESKDAPEDEQPDEDHHKESSDSETVPEENNEKQPDESEVKTDKKPAKGSSSKPKPVTTRTPRAKKSEFIVPNN